MQSSEQHSVNKRNPAEDDLLAGYLSIPQLAKELRVTARTIMHWRHFRRGPKAVRIGKRVYFRREDVHAWLAQHAEQQEAAA